MTSIGEVLRGRTDLSAFVVHFTRGLDPEANLKSILAGGRIEARNPHGWNIFTLRDSGVRAVCFTETPLEFLSLMCGQIQGRTVQMSQWGLAFGKYQARLLGANPVLYTQGYPNQFGGVHQAAKALNTLRDALDDDRSGVAPLSPSMRTACETLLSSASKMERQGRAREWWWEREWRRIGDYNFSTEHVAFGLCPRDHVIEMEKWSGANIENPIRFLSPSWTIEETISHLALLPEDNPPWPNPRY